MTRIYLITFIFLIAGCLTAKKKAEFSVSVPENLSIVGEMQLTTTPMEI